MKYKAFKQKLSIALAAMMIMASASTVSFAAGFSDLSQASWAKATIEEWAQKGLVSGYPDGTFKASNTITRAESVATLNNVINPVTIVVDNTEQTVTPPSAGGGGGGGGGDKPTTPVDEASKYDYFLKAEYYRNGVLTENAVRKFDKNETVTADLIYDFYDDNKDALKSKLSGADGLITRALSLESDNGTVYSQAIAQAILNYSGTLNVVNKTADAALLNSLATGGSVSDVQALAQKFADSTLAEIEADIVALYGTKTISNVNKSGLVFKVTNGTALAPVASTTTMSGLKSELLKNAGTLYSNSGKTVLELSIGNTKILIKVEKELKN